MVIQETWFERFLAWLKGFIGGYYELCSVISGWLTSLSVIAISITLFVPAVNAALPWLSESCQVAINISLDAALFGCTALANRAKDEGNQRQSILLGWAAKGFGVLIIITMIFSYLKIDGVPLICLLIVRWSTAIWFASATHGKSDKHHRVATLVARIEELEANEQRANEVATRRANELEQLKAKGAKAVVTEQALFAQVSDLTATTQRLKEQEVLSIAACDEMRVEARLAQGLRARETELLALVDGLRAREVALLATVDGLKNQANEVERLRVHEAELATTLESVQAKLSESERLRAKEQRTSSDGLKAKEPRASTKKPPSTSLTSREKIKRAMLQISAEGKELKYQDIADRAEVGYSTVKLHFKDIQDDIRQAEKPRLKLVGE